MAKQPKAQRPPRPSGWADLQQFAAHGSTELANILVHSHPAPMYARSASPAELQSPEAPQTKPSKEVTTPEQTTQDKSSLLDNHLSGIGAKAEAPAQEIDSPHASMEAPSTSLLDQHLNGVRQPTPELSQPELELEQ